jgi:hypothetical protein
MAKTTNREYLAWMEWLDQRWNEPDRTDHYLMQIAREVAYAHVDPKKVGDMKIRFSKQVFEAPRKPMTRREASAAARARWSHIAPVRKEDRHGR